MKNIIFSMKPRQTGKTENAMYEYFKDPENTLFVSLKKDYITNLSKRANRNRIDFLNHITSKSLPNFIRGRRFKTIILDEYMFFSNKKEIYDALMMYDFDTLIIYSTSDKIYDAKTIDFIRENKNRGYDYTTIRDFYTQFLDMLGRNDVNLLKEFDLLYFNFLTEPKTRIIDHVSIYTEDTHTKNSMEKLKKFMTEYDFKYQYLNIWKEDIVFNIEEK